MNAAFFARMLLRESRGFRGRLTFFVGCLSIGVAAVVAVAGLSASVEDVIRTRARDILGADITVESRRPLPPELDPLLARIGAVQTTDVWELATVVALPSRGADAGKSQLVELKVIDGEYPFYGAVDTIPPGGVATHLDATKVVCARELCTRLGARVGDTLMIGGVEFEIAAEALADPDRIDFSLALGPRVFVDRAGIDRTSLVTFGSRVEYRRMVKLPADTTPDGVNELVRRLRDDLPQPNILRVEGFGQAQPALRRTIERVDSFLGLLALLSLLLGGIGVAQTVRAWLASRMEAIAILKCIGMRPREVLFLYLEQTALLALVGSAVGITAGVLANFALPKLLAGIVPASLIEPWQITAVLRGLVLGLGVAFVFSIPPLLAILRVPPALVLRREPIVSRPPALVRSISVFVLVTGVYCAAWLQAHSAWWALQFSAGLWVAAGLLALSARALLWCAARVPREKVALAWRYGLAAVARPDAGSLSAVMALGLGILLVLAMYLVQDRLSEELSGALSEETPTAFMVDIQREQWSGIESTLASHGATRIDSVPVISARLTAIEGVSVEELSRQRRESGQRGRWVLTREQRLTYLDELPKDNKILEGSLWSDPDHAEVSLEEGYAQDLGATLGTRITFDVQGVPLELLVTSIRSVEWRTFGINFFIVVEPGLLETAPQFRVAAAHVGEAETQALQDTLARDYPNVTLVQIRAILEKVQAALTEIGRGVRVLGAFSVLSGLAILAGAIGASAVRRGREVALLKTIGLTRFQVAAVHCVEYALIGCFAAAIGVAGGTLLSWAVLDRGMEIRFTPAPLPLIVSGILAVTLSVLAGLGASARALAAKPLAVLRAE